MPLRLQDRFHLEARITPHRVRHIMVTFVQQNPAVFERHRDQMANLMGHSLRQWQVRLRTCALVWLAVYLM